MKNEQQTTIYSARPRNPTQYNRQGSLEEVKAVNGYVELNGLPCLLVSFSTKKLGIGCIREQNPNKIHAHSSTFSRPISNIKPFSIAAIHLTEKPILGF